VTLAEALRKDVYQTKRELARILRITPRDVEQMVEHNRKAGALPIMSGPDGYRLARNPDEYALNVERRHKRALVQLVTVQGEKAYLERWRAHLNPPDEPAAVQEAIQW
jgi:Mn-dependent DtxR family transcriptional regulator